MGAGRNHVPDKAALTLVSIERRCARTSFGLSLSAMERTTPSRSKGSALRRLWPLGLLALTAAIAIASGATGYLSFHQLAESRAALRAYVADHHIASVALYALAYLTIATCSLPAGVLMTMAGGFLLGPWIGAPTAILCAVTGASFVFWIARSSLGEALRVHAGPRIEWLRRGFAEDAVFYMLFLRLTPLFPFSLVNIASAALGVKYRTFFWTTLIGIAPGTLAYSVAGSGLESVMQAQERIYSACLAAAQADCQLRFSARQLVTRELVWSIAALGVLALTPVIVRRLWGRRFRNLMRREAGAR